MQRYGLFLNLQAFTPLFLCYITYFLIYVKGNNVIRYKKINSRSDKRSGGVKIDLGADYADKLHPLGIKQEYKSV